MAAQDEDDDLLFDIIWIVPINSVTYIIIYFNYLMVEKANCSVCSQPSEALKQCSLCHDISYCSQDCQRKDWPRHKSECTDKKSKTDIDQYLTSKQKELKYDDFEVIKKLGDGNFTEIYKV